MASGRFLLAATLSLSASTALPPIASAQDNSQAESENRHTFLGEVNANAVFVRSRASEDAYPTMRLNKGDQVTVVGIRGNWLKITPPANSFAYVPKSFINLRADGTIGRANREAIARAGSDLNELAAQPLATVHEGEDVTIIGQHNEYFKIKPPKESYLWVNKQFVDPKETVVADASENGSQRAAQPKQNEPANAGAAGEHPQTARGRDDQAGPATRPAEVVENTGAQPSTTQPAFNPVAEYDKLEQQFNETNNKPLMEQPLPELLAGYQKIMESDDLPPSMRRIAEIRIATLKVRNDARSKFLAAKDEQKKMADKQQALLAERQEIEERIKKNDIQLFAAVGTLRTSSLQVGQGMLYRLTDPASGRTVAYIRTNDPKYAGFLGQFIGVKGKVTNDPQLKSILENPPDAQQVDPSLVNTKIAAQIVPPSLNRFTAPPATVVVPEASEAQAAPPPTVAPATNGTPSEASTGGQEPQ